MAIEAVYLLDIATTQSSPAMNELERPERLQIMLSAEELQALENFRFENRMPSRAAAVRELLRRGLAAEGYMSAETGTRSQDFGVISRADRGGNGTSPNDADGSGE